jgi:cysteinyl-tRNA synthetase
MGKKMSKSLKNFITIKHILTEYSARQVRMLFLLHGWDSLMNYTTEKSMPEAVEKERQFAQFFKDVKAILRQVNVKDTNQKWGARDYELNEVYTRAQKIVHESLADNFDTAEAIKVLNELVTMTNSYLQQDKSLIKLPLVRQISKYVFKILKVFGVYDEDVFPSQLKAVDESDSHQAASYEEVIAPLMNVLSKFRDTIKAQADQGPGTLFKLCDELRDDILPHLGVRLEDRAKGQDAIWKYEDKEVLLKERADKIREKELKELEKKKRKEEEIRKKSTPPTEWFKVFRGNEFSKYEPDTGIPTHDAKDKEISESIRNKLKKEWNK